MYASCASLGTRPCFALQVRRHAKRFPAIDGTDDFRFCGQPKRSGNIGSRPALKGYCHAAMIAAKRNGTMQGKDQAKSQRNPASTIPYNCRRVPAQIRIQTRREGRDRIASAGLAARLLLLAASSSDSLTRSVLPFRKLASTRHDAARRNRDRLSTAGRGCKDVCARQLSVCVVPIISSAAVAVIGSASNVRKFPTAASIDPAGAYFEGSHTERG